MVFSGMLLVLQVVSLVIMVPLSALLLMFSTKIFKLSDQSYKTAIITTLIIYVISFVLSLIGMFAATLILSVISIIVMVVLGLWLIKTRYKLEWGKAALVWLVWFIFTLIASSIVGFIVGMIFASQILAATI